METKDRSYPDISFVETDTETIVNALIQSYEKFTGRTLYPADPARLFILWVADVIIQERVNIDFSAKQNVPRYAEGEYLDSLAELFNDTYRSDSDVKATSPESGEVDVRVLPTGGELPEEVLTDRRKF